MIDKHSTATYIICLYSFFNDCDKKNDKGKVLIIIFTARQSMCTKCQISTRVSCHNYDRAMTEPLRLSCSLWGGMLYIVPIIICMGGYIRLGLRSQHENNGCESIYM